MNNGPQLWDAILAGVRQVYGPDAIIAGGAVRDYLLGAEPKDIDVFVNWNDDDTLVSRARDLPSAFDLDDLEEATEYELHPDFQPEIAGVLDGTYRDADRRSWRVQIIARPMNAWTPQALMQCFDSAITRCWYGGDVVEQTNEQLRDLQNKTVTILRADSGDAFGRSKERATRFIQRWDYAYRLVDGRVPA